MCYKTVPLAIIGLMILSVVSYGITIDGYCYLENQSNHSETRILFVALTPSAITDSIFTDSTGYYQIDLTPGNYDVFIRHEGFTSENLLNQFFYISVTLPEVTLLQIPEGILLSGSLSGILEDTIYVVEGEISVADGDLLTIEPGAVFYFLGSGSNIYRFSIYGYLEALGTESNQIYFQPAFSNNTWGGLDFLHTTDDTSRLEYCYITGSYSSGIYCYQSNPNISHCTIIDNFYLDGGGILLYNSNPTITNCTITSNTADEGGGIACVNSSPIIENCMITMNVAPYAAGIHCNSGSDPIIENCTISGNIASYICGGIRITNNSNPTISHCTVNSNTGSGISIHGDCNAIVNYCVLTGNSGSGISFYQINNSTVNHCTISGNSGSGVYCYESSPTIVNNIIEGNSGSGGINILDSPNLSFTYNNLYDNLNGNFAGDPPPYLGHVITTNFNGDSCDTYFNIFEDPLFINPSNGDYHLQSSSPCIDAGDPNSPLDPDSTIADIGAFYYNQLWVGKLTPVEITTYQLMQNYPNPFNPTTTLSYNLPFADHVRLQIYDILGRLVSTIIDTRQPAGQHQILFDASNLSSGVYFYQLKTSNFQDIKKMVLLK